MTVISVFGSATPQPGSSDYQLAFEVGQHLARAGYTVQTGGYSGIMAAASQGANEANGHVIGITSSQIELFRPGGPNDWVLEEIKYPTLRERLFHVVEQCDAAVVLPGGIGTLAELALIWNFVQTGEIRARPIVTIGHIWKQTLSAFISPDYIHPDHSHLVHIANTPSEAVSYIQQMLKD